MTIYERWRRGDFEDSSLRKALKSNVIHYCELYRAFLLSRNKGHGYEASVELTADAMCTSQRTVKRAISFVNQ